MADQILKTLTTYDGTTITVLRDAQNVWFECSQGCSVASAGPIEQEHDVNLDAEYHRAWHNNR